MGSAAGEEDDPRARRFLPQGWPGVRHEVGPASAAVRRGVEVGLRRLPAGVGQEDRRDCEERIRRRARVEDVQIVRDSRVGVRHDRAGARRARGRQRQGDQGGGQGSEPGKRATDAHGHEEHARRVRVYGLAEGFATLRSHLDLEGVPRAGAARVRLQTRGADAHAHRRRHPRQGSRR